jgi:hypothetical protein
VDADEFPMGSGTLLALQLRAAGEPFLPRLKSLDCEYATHDFLPFIPFLLSPQTTEINIFFASDAPTVAAASIISMFPTLCPNLERIILNDLDRDPVIIDAVSEMLLSCNRGALRVFEVDSPLTEEAREVVYQLPNLSGLRTIIEGHTSLPQMALPSLTEIDVEYNSGHLDWLQGFRGAVLGKLERVSFRSESKQIGDLLGPFAKVALTASAQNTLSEFGFYTFCPWTPDYYSLLPFKQLRVLNIQFTCYRGCSSRVDDDVITALARAMPKLEILQLGRAPCKIPTGATVQGLIILSSSCPNLSKLRIHFQGHTLVDAATTFPPTDKPAIPREGCVLTDLEVGYIPIPVQEATKIAQVLLRLFPRINHVEFIHRGWERVEEYIKDFRRTGALVRHADSPAFVDPE